MGNELRERLCRRYGAADLKEMCHLVHSSEDDTVKEAIYSLIHDDDRRVIVNALWTFTHFPAIELKWLDDKHDELIDLAMRTHDKTIQRLSLALLNKQKFTVENMRVDFLDFCMECIMKSSEPLGVRSLCMKLAYKMCHYYPELTAELLNTFDMMPDSQSPAIRSCRKNILKSINLHKKA